MAKLGFGILMVMQNEWAEGRGGHRHLPRIATEAGHTPRPPIILTNVCCAESRERGAGAGGQVSRPEMAVDRRPLPFLRRPSRRPSKATRATARWRAPTPRSTKAPRRKAKATDFYVSIQIVGTPDDCLQKIAELQRLTGTDHLVTEFSFGAMPHEEAELNMRLFADRVMPRLQRDPAFAAPQIGGHAARAG